MEPRSLSGVFADRYELRGLLGRGGMGAVYRALDTAVGDEVALKAMWPDVARSPDAADRFRREVRLARRITHRNVARIHDLGVHEDVLYLTMELVEGQSLADVLAARGRVSPRSAIEMAAQIADGLAAAHDSGVVHRDLKPANVMLADDHRAVITDFGIARALSPGSQAAVTTGLVGTLMYMSPEQVQGLPVDARTDIYALGLVVYELLTGKPPFSGGTPIAIAVARLEQTPPTLHGHQGIDDPLADLVAACLARNPEERPADARELARRLREVRPGRESQPSQTDTLAAGQAPTLAANGSTAKPESRPPSTSGSAAIASDRSVAVLPFRFRGDASQEYLADAITEELVDVLTTIRGIKTLSSRASAPLASADDPTAEARHRGIDVLIEGSVHAAPGRIRVTSRLIEVRSAMQVWSERFEVAPGDELEIQERVGRRVAESLRVGLTVHTAPDVPPEAVQCYLRARANLRGYGLRSGEVSPLEELERAVSLAPTFAPAVAAHAIATLRAWFVPVPNPTEDWESRARHSVERALELAPGLAETHLARGIFCVNVGEYRAAVRSLAEALHLAPTYAEAHEYLGRIECEAGRAREGMRRLSLSLELDPTQAVGPFMLARAHALRGEWDEYQAALDRIPPEMVARHPAAVTQRVRIALWRNDVDDIRRLVENQPRLPVGAAALFRTQTAVILGNADPHQTHTELENILAGMASTRFRGLAHQMAVEVFAFVGAHELALHHLQAARDALLIDVEWLDRCPVLDPLRTSSVFVDVLDTIRARVDEIWRR